VNFTLDERLAGDTEFLVDWPLCRVLLMNDQQYPWCILVPRVMSDNDDVMKELYELSDDQRAQFDLESVFLSKTLMQYFQGEKLNIAALGNVVSQLHIHHVVRFKNDIAWPAPIWGRHSVKPYDDAALTDQKEALINLLKPAFA